MTFKRKSSFGICIQISCAWVAPWDLGRKFDKWDNWWCRFDRRTLQCTQSNRHQIKSCDILYTNHSSNESRTNYGVIRHVHRARQSTVPILGWTALNTYGRSELGYWLQYFQLHGELSRQSSSEIMTISVHENCIASYAYFLSLRIWPYQLWEWRK